MTNTRDWVFFFVEMEVFLSEARRDAQEELELRVMNRPSCLDPIPDDSEGQSIRNHRIGETMQESDVATTKEVMDG